MAEEKPDFREAYRALDPARPLEGYGLQTHYAERPTAPIAKLAVEIKERSQPYRAIVAGQRGVGKTTELNWLKWELGKSHESVHFFDVGRVATTNAATALAFVTKELSLQAELPNLRKIVQKHEWLDWDFRVMGAELKPEQITEVQGTLKAVTGTIKGMRSRELVLLLDGWERVAANHEAYTFMDALEGVDCSIVFVTRLSVILESAFNRYRPDWDLTLVSAEPLYDYDRNIDENGWCLLKTVLEKRVGQDAFGWDALRVIFQASGGIFRELVSLARHSCLLAERASKDRVTAKEATAALTQQRLNQTATLSKDDRDMLRGVVHSDRTWADQERLAQVNQGRIVAYHRDSLWFDVHPILWPLFGLNYPVPPAPFY